MTHCYTILFLLALFRFASNARLQASQQTRVRGSGAPKVIEEVHVKKLRHSGLMTWWDARYLTLSEYETSDGITFKLEYAKNNHAPVSETFDICGDKVKAGAAEGRGAGAFQIFTTAGHRNYVFKPDKGSDLRNILSLINTKARACDERVEVVKEGTVMKKAHSKMGFDAKFLVLRIEPLASGRQFVLEYLSPWRSMASVTWDVCDPSLIVDNGGEHKFTVAADVNEERGRKHASFTFRAIGQTETEKTMQTKDWIDQIQKLQDLCNSEDEGLDVVDVVNVLPEVVDDNSIEEESQDQDTSDSKAQFIMIDARTENLLQLKDMMIASSDKLPIDQTLVAFDFDLTLRDDNPDGGSMLRLEETTRELLTWLKENGAPAIVVTARNPSPGTWERTWKQAEEQLLVADLLGQHVPPLVDDAVVSAPCKKEDSQCNVFKYQHDNGLYVGDFKFVEGRGMVIAGYQKGEAILHYIKVHGMNIKQVIFADDYSTNAVNVAHVCKDSDSIHRVVGVWFAPFDVESGTKEFVDSILDRTRQLTECLKTEKFSECKPKFYASSWCDSTVAGFLGDNGYNPVQPPNLYNVETVLLGHFPTTDEEREKPEAALKVAQAQEQEIVSAQRFCKDMEKKEIEDDRKAEAAKLVEAGELPPCTSTVKCMQNLNKAPEKRKCDINVEACAHLL